MTISSETEEQTDEQPQTSEEDMPEAKQQEDEEEEVEEEAEEEETESEEEVEEEEEDSEIEQARTPIEDSTDTQATVRATVSQIERILSESAIGYHDNPYVNIKEDGVIRIIAGSPGNVVVNYSDYTEGAVEAVHGSTEAMISVSDILDTLNLIGDRNSEIVLNFEGVDGSRLAQRLRIEGELEAGILLPGSESVLGKVPLDLPEMFNEDDRLLNPESGVPADAHISTFISSFEKITDVVDMKEELNNFPVVVEDGQFRLDVGNRSQNFIAGGLAGEVLEGEDFENMYGEGLEKVAKNLTGEVDVYAEQGSPVCIVKERSHGTIRHVIGPAEG